MADQGQYRLIQNINRLQTILRYTDGKITEIMEDSNRENHVEELRNELNALHHDVADAFADVFHVSDHTHEP
jgi:hypothetical protein